MFAKCSEIINQLWTQSWLISASKQEEDEEGVEPLEQEIKSSAWLTRDRQKNLMQMLSCDRWSIDSLMFQRFEAEATDPKLHVYFTFWLV